MFNRLFITILSLEASRGRDRIRLLLEEDIIRIVKEWLVLKMRMGLWEVALGLMVLLLCRSNLVMEVVRDLV
jgi:hypothetical protein